MYFTLKDSTLQQSSAFRNAAEMLPAILAESPEPIVVVKRTDGGSEQNMKNASVQLADISLWKKSGADMLFHTRPAANGSWVNDAEGAMPGANLALQHQSNDRAMMDPAHESMFGSSGSMSAVRAKIASIQDAQKRAAAAKAWRDSMQPTIDGLKARFERVEYTERNWKWIDAADQTTIAEMHAVITEIEPNWKTEMTTQPEVKKLERLQKFFETHCFIDPYIFIVSRNSPTASSCTHLRMPQANRGSELREGRKRMAPPPPPPPTAPGRRRRTGSS